VIQNNFPAVKEAAHELVQEARLAWIETGKQVSNKRFQNGAATRGYALQGVIEGETIGFQSARIYIVGHSEKWGDDPWFFRFFEYGTVYITAMPFIRPGARAANKVFMAMMGTQLDRKIRMKSRGWAVTKRAPQSSQFVDLIEITAGRVRGGLLA